MANPDWTDPLDWEDRPAPSRGTIVGPEPASEAEHFIVCEECGEAFDCRDLGAVLHHEQPGHSPVGRQG